MALVSILIPTYNRAALLGESIESALAQSHREIEVLILDDASPDDTASVASQFGSDSRVRYVRHPRNLGIVGNWKAGLELARGEFFCFLHDDDTFEPEFVAALLEPMQRDAGLIAAFSDHWVMDARGQRSIEKSDAASRHFGRAGLAPGKQRDFARAALIDSSLPVGATLFRKSLISPEWLDERARGSIDMFLFLGCVLSGHEAYYVPQKLMNYRVHEGGMSRSMPVHMAQGHIFRYHSILAQPSLSELHPEIRALLTSIMAQTALTLVGAGEIGQGRSWARDSWRVKPNGRALSVLLLSCLGRNANFLFRRARGLK